MAPKATMRQATETPSESVVNSAAQIQYEIDARGRKIGVVKHTAIARFRLMKILGPENAKNEPLVGNAMLAFLVREINGEQVMQPNSERQLEAIIERLDDDGLAAVAKCLIDKFGVEVSTDSDEITKNS